MKNKRRLPKRLREEVKQFFEYTPPARLSRNLRKLLTAYLILERDGESLFREDLFIDMENLFDLLDVAGDELTV